MNRRIARKRRYRKGLKKYSKKLPMYKQLPILMGSKFFARMKYTEIIDLDAPVGGILATHVFSANSLYDPNRTGVGHQPRGFDQLMALYDHFTVISSKITAKSQYSHSVPVCTGITLRDTVTATNSLVDNMESRYTKYQTAIHEKGNQTVLKNYYSTKRFFNTKNLYDDQFEGSSASSPLEEAFYYIWVGAMNLADNPGSFPIVVTIEYLAVFHEPTLPTIS